MTCAPVVAESEPPPSTLQVTSELKELVPVTEASSATLSLANNSLRAAVMLME